MLSPEQVLPFLNHPDTGLRDHAAKYFTLLGQSAPFETASELWRAIDGYGDQLTQVGTFQHIRFLHALAKVPKDEACVDRTLVFLGKRDVDSESSFAAFDVLTHLPVELQQKRLDDILPALNKLHRGHIEKRLALIDVPAEELWHRLVQLSQTAEAAEESRDIDHAMAGLLVEALARYPEVAAPLAMAGLQDPRERWWLQIWSAALVGTIGHTPAIDLLIEKAQIDDADYLRENAVEALSLMDPSLVIPKLESAYLSDDQFFRMDIAEAMGNTLHPLAEAALLRLLAEEKDKSAATAIACALSNLCTTKGLEPLRQIVLAHRYDTTIDDVKQLLVVSSLMAGFDFPELEKWKVEIHDPAYKAQLRKKFLSSFGMDEKTVKLFGKYLKDPAAFAASPEPDESPRGLSSLKTDLPYRREQPKIGRNDPCPCGSGKKHKKCCGK